MNIEQTRDFFKDLIDEAAVCVYVSDADTYDAIYCNNALLKTMGLTAEQAYGMKCYELMEGRTSPCEGCNKADKIGRYTESVYFCKPVEKHFRVKSTLVQTQGRELYVVYLTDITTLIDTNRDMTNMTQRLQAIMNTVPGGIAIHEIKDGKGISLYSNDAMMTLTGYSQDEYNRIVGEDTLQLVFEEDLPMIRDVLRSAIQDGTNIDVVYRIKNKQTGYRWVHSYSTQIKNENENPAFYAMYVDITEEKQRQIEVKTQQEKIQMVLDRMDVFVWEYDIISDTYHVDSEEQRTVETSFAREPFNKELLSPASVIAYDEIIKKIRDGERYAECEVEFFSKVYNKYRWYSIKYSTIFDEDDKPVKAVGMSTCLDEYKALEQRYNEEIENRRQINRDCVVSVKVNITKGIVEDCLAFREELEPLCQYTNANDLFNVIFKYIVSEKDREEAKKIFSLEGLMENYNQGKLQLTIEYRTRMPNGESYWLTTSINILEEPETGDIVYFSYTYDVTRRKIIELIMEQIMDSEYEFFGVLNVQRNILTIFQAEIGVYGVEDGYALDFDAFVPEATAAVVIKEELDEAIKALCRETLLAQMDKTGTYTCAFDTYGTDKTVGRKKWKFAYLDETKAFITVSISDITDTYRLELEQIAQMEGMLRLEKKANAAKTMFLSNMSHDMRTPMSAIIGLSSKEFWDQSSDKEMQDYLQKINSSAEYLLSLINDVLDMSKIESNKFELKLKPVNPRRLIVDIASLVDQQRIKKNISINFDICDFDPRYDLVVDEVRLKQIFINIISNSIKFTDIGGKIEVKIDKLAVSPSTAKLRVAITDNGIGMSEEFLPKLFAPFEQEDHSYKQGAETGTGLGMSIVKKIVDEMGGDIKVNSKQGVGTQFVITLTVPIQLREEEIVSTGHGELPGTNSNPNVLLAEDSPINAEVVKKILGKQGYKVDVAENGRRCVELFEGHEPYYYGLILMDVRMPEMDGLEATRTIRNSDRKDGRNIPIVALTANVMVDDIDMTIEVGMNEYLSKPIDPSKLVETVKKYQNRE
ncbi:MAG TPA: ATP-binding protein [Anaerovoracaceae bacterium]|nr:ATP-binding protein [Anaerovoracaceae bacterium]